MPKCICNEVIAKLPLLEVIIDHRAHTDHREKEKYYIYYLCDRCVLCGRPGAKFYRG
jgi:hypothetical protein